MLEERVSLLSLLPKTSLGALLLDFRASLQSLDLASQGPGSGKDSANELDISLMEISSGNAMAIDKELRIIAPNLHAHLLANRTDEERTGPTAATDMAPPKARMKPRRAANAPSQLHEHPRHDDAEEYEEAGDDASFWQARYAELFANYQQLLMVTSLQRDPPTYPETRTKSSQVLQAEGPSLQPPLPHVMSGISHQQSFLEGWKLGAQQSMQPPSSSLHGGLHPAFRPVPPAFPPSGPDMVPLQKCHAEASVGYGAWMPPGATAAAGSRRASWQAHPAGLQLCHPNKSAPAPRPPPGEGEIPRDAPQSFPGWMPQGFMPWQPPGGLPFASPSPSYSYPYAPMNREHRLPPLKRPKHQRLQLEDPAPLMGGEGPLPSPFACNQGSVLKSIGPFPDFAEDVAPEARRAAAAATAGNAQLPHDWGTGHQPAYAPDAAAAPADVHGASMLSGLPRDKDLGGAEVGAAPSMPLQMSSRFSIPVLQLLRLLHHVAGANDTDEQELGVEDNARMQEESTHLQAQQGYRPDSPTPHQPQRREPSQDGPVDLSMVNSTPFTNRYFAAAAAAGLSICPVCTLSKVPAMQGSAQQKRHKKKQQNQDPSHGQMGILPHGVDAAMHPHPQHAAGPGESADPQFSGRWQHPCQGEPSAGGEPSCTLRTGHAGQYPAERQLDSRAFQQVSCMASVQAPVPKPRKKKASKRAMQASLYPWPLPMYGSLPYPYQLPGGAVPHEANREGYHAPPTRGPQHEIHTLPMPPGHAVRQPAPPPDMAPLPLNPAAKVQSSDATEVDSHSERRAGPAASGNGSGSQYRSQGSKTKQRSSQAASSGGSSGRPGYPAIQGTHSASQPMPYRHGHSPAAYGLSHSDMSSQQLAPSRAPPLLPPGVGGMPPPGWPGYAMLPPLGYAPPATEKKASKKKRRQVPGVSQPYMPMPYPLGIPPYGYAPQLPMQQLQQLYPPPARKDSQCSQADLNLTQPVHSPAPTSA